MAREDVSDLVIWHDEHGVVHIRNSERGTLDRCPQQWWWGWREGLRAKETARPLWFGTAIHEGLAEWYQPGKKRSKDYIDKFRESADMEAEYIRTEVGGMDEDEWVDARTLGETMLRGYVETYGKDPNWNVIATEQEFEVRIPAPFLKAGYFILNGTVDGVYVDEGDRNKPKLMEHKTAASISVAHLPMDNQAGTYWMVAHTVGRSQGWLGPKQNIGEITYNFLRKAMPTTKQRDAQGYVLNKPTKDHFIAALNGVVEWETTRTGTVKYPTIAVMEEMATEHGITVLGDRSKVQPPPLFERHPVKKTPHMRKMQLSRMVSEVERMQMYVDGRLEITKAPSRDHCGWCPFREMCELHEHGSDWVEFRDALFRSTDPYEDHRKSAAS